jgi:hypothetical protein
MRGLPAVALALVCIALWVLAVLLSASYYVPASGLSFSAPLPWRRLLDLIPLVGWRELQHVLGVSDAAFGISVALALVGVFASARSGPQSLWILGLMSPVVLLFPRNVLGCLALVTEPLRRGPYDGEFLAEDWPVTYAYAVWSICAPAVLVWTALKAQRISAREVVESRTSLKAGAAEQPDAADEARASPAVWRGPRS